ncbi:MAG TPA: crosslink repair DNA glycosylase YcaQ family protein [Polyangiaceae bacterium]
MTAKRAKPVEVGPEQVREFWAARQAMAGGLARKKPAEVLAATGWLRSVGGSNPYVALRDRAGLSRAAIDAAVAALEIHELPSARGCTYVVPAQDFALALDASRGHGDDAGLATAKKYLGVTDREIDKLCTRVLDAVAGAPLDPAGIKESVGDAVRSLGAEGKKRGVTTTLPLALGRLQGEGEIRRVPVDGRLDQQRYRYVAWRPGPFGKRARSPSQEETAIGLARRYFRWAGPATIKNFSWWSGLGVTAARAAVVDIGLVPLAEGDDRLLYAEDREELLSRKPARAPAVSFVASLDNLVHLRRAVAPHLDEADAKRDVPGMRQKLGTVMDLEYHPICDRGRIVGLWDWDGLKGELAWKTFGARSREVASAATAFAEYVQRDLSDVRSFSLDSPESRKGRIAALR